MAYVRLPFVPPVATRLPHYEVRGFAPHPHEWFALGSRRRRLLTPI
jgi:hypothetical protein